MRYFLLSLAAAGCFATRPAQAQTAPAGSPQAKNMAADYALLQVFETGDVSKLDAIIAPEFVNHTAGGDRKGLAEQKTMVQGFHAHMPNVKMTVKRRWADGEYVNDWVVYSSDTSGSPVIDGIELTRYANGKAVEHWFFPNSQKAK